MMSFPTNRRVTCEMMLQGLKNFYFYAMIKRRVANLIMINIDLINQNGIKFQLFIFLVDAVRFVSNKLLLQNNLI